jgi:CDGSH-type Zn-finger protein
MPDKNTITVSYNGPLYVHGNTELIDAKGEKLENTRIALCRCGKSKNRPLCDGAHYHTNFRDSGIISSDNMRHIKEKQNSGRLMINTDKKGPLKIAGNVVILSSKDEIGFTGETIVLCGCGRSKNTPFCDGSHLH